MINKNKLTLAMVPMMAIALSGCSEADKTKEDITFPTTMSGLYEKAKVEGAVTVYGPTENLYAPVYEIFKEKYPGIEIKTANIFGQELDTRLEGESFSGGFKADMVHIGVSDIERFYSKNYLTSYSPIGTEKLPSQYKGDGSLWHIPSRHLYSVAYNTDKVSSDMAPKVWNDLMNQRWNGKISMSNPSISGATPQVLSSALAAGAIDYNWIESFKDQEQKIYPSVSTSLQAVITGENDIALVAGYGTLMRQKQRGAPLAMAPLQDGAYMSDVGYALLKDSPNPNAARLLMSWSFTEEGQKAIAEHVYEFGTMPGAPTPTGSEELPNFTGVPYPGGDKYKEVLEKLNKIFN